MSVLYLGVPEETFLARFADGACVVADSATCTWIQLVQQFDVVVINALVVKMTTPARCRAVVHAATQHLSPGGRVIALFAPEDDAAVAAYEQMCCEFSLEPDGHEVDSHFVVAHRRTTEATIHDLVFEARSRIGRISPWALRAALETQDPPIVIDTRTNTDRERFGVIRGSIHISRTTLEWSCDATNGYRHPAITDRSQPLVIVCNGGYSSSLAASNLALLGFASVSDLIGGYQAWARAGYEVVPADHSSLDY